MKFLRYIYIVLKHKWYVLRAGVRLKIPLRTLITHDISKFCPDELVPYARHFCGEAPFPKEAVEKHYQRNHHHPEHWVDHRMPNESIKEMAADLHAANRQYGGDGALAYYCANKERFGLDATNDIMLREYLSVLEMDE